MKLPKMTPKRWFRSAMAAALVWSAVGWRWGGGEGSSTQDDRLPWMAAVQNGLSQPMETAIVPPCFLFTSAQATIQYLAAGATAEVPGTPEALREKVRDLQNENVRLQALLAEANARLDALGYLHAARIEANDVLPATVIGFQSGPGSAILRLDKGALHGVKPGDAVIAPLQQVHVLGRIEKADLGQAQCLVRLITDPTMRITAQIVRPNVQPAITGEMCLVEGLGDGTMRIENVDTADKITNRPITPQKGDFVCLTDGRWPAKLQHMVLGQIESISVRKDQPMRYDIRVTPRVPISAQRTVMILLHD